MGSSSDLILCLQSRLIWKLLGTFWHTPDIFWRQSLLVW